LDVSPFVWRVEHFDEIDSTNTYLRQLVTDDLPEGHVVLSDFQHAGRGRLDRAWIATPRSSLLCSILLRPPLKASQLQLVVAAVALSTRVALERLSGLRAQLKWPNDLVVGENKLAGLLAEVVDTPHGFAVVVGLGVNLTFEGPDNLDILLEELEARRLQLESEAGRAALRREYERALSTIGRTVRVEQPRATYVGRATGVDDAGQLLVDVDGTLTTFDVGDVVHVRSEESEPA
jgi:BirA family biotin operon repressor/biotin-[acetyl-CoA-carboxylase] ligase